MWDRIREMLRKEMIQTLRNPRMRLLLLAPPIVELIIFGYAVNLDVENSRIAWLDRDNSPQSRELLVRFEASGYFQITEMLNTSEQIHNVLDRDKVVAAVHVLPGFGRDVQRGETGSVQVVVDGTNSNTAGIVANYASQIIAGYGGRTGENSSASGDEAGAAPPSPRLTVQSRVWFNPELKSRDYFVPGVLVNVIALVTIMLTAMSIVREKEIGTMEQLMVTPIRPMELMIGKLLPFAAIGVLDVAMVTGAALVVFHIPFRGSSAVLLAGTILFLLTTLGVGLFISTVSQTQQQALMSSFFFFMPAILLSGFAFPVRNMPTPVRFLTYLNPLRYFMEIVRGVFLKGSGLQYLWPQMMALAIIGVTCLALSIARFRKRLD